MATIPTGTAQITSPGSIPEALHFEQPNLADLLAHTPAAIAVLSGPELRCSYVNEMALKVTGRRAADQLLGQTFSQCFPELEGTGVFEIFNEVVVSRHTFFGREFKVSFLQFEEGTLEDRYIDFVCQTMLDSSGGLSGIFIHAIDLTDRVLNRRAMEASQERLRLAHEAAQIGTWEWDGVANSRTLSPELHGMFGTDASASQKAIEELWASRVHPGDRHRVYRLM